ncbi:MAG: hypothetical protein WCJ67_07540 [Thermoleophilia bacterium]
MDDQPAGVVAPVEAAVGGGDEAEVAQRDGTAGPPGDARHLAGEGR